MTIEDQKTMLAEIRSLRDAMKADHEKHLEILADNQRINQELAAAVERGEVGHVEATIDVVTRHQAAQEVGLSLLIKSQMSQSLFGTLTASHVEAMAERLDKLETQVAASIEPELEDPYDLGIPSSFEADDSE